MGRRLDFTIAMSAVAGGAISGMLKVGSAMKTVAKNSDELEKKMKELKTAQQNLERVERLKQNYVNVSKEFLQASRKLRELKEAYEKTGSSNEKLAAKIKEQEKVVNSLNTKKKEQKKLFEMARSSIDAEGSSLKKYKEHLANVSEELEKQRKLKEAQARYDDRAESIGKLKNAGDRALSFGTKVGTATLVPVKMYTDLENAQADIKKIIDFGTKEAEVKFNQAMRNISDRSPLSQPELYEIAGAGAQAGIAKEELIAFTNDAQRIKVAFDMNTVAAGEFLAKTRSQLKLNQSEVMAYADTINYLSDNTASQATDIVEVSQRIASLGGIAGVSKEGVAAFGATLVSIGKTPEIAAAGLKNLYSDLMVGTAATKSQKAAFAALGLEAEQVAKSMVQDGEGTIMQVLSRIKELPKHMQAATVKQLFGQEALDSVVGLSENLEALEKNIGLAKSTMANGAVEREYSNRLNTLGNEVKISFNKFRNAGIDLGRALAPAIKNLLEAVTPIIEKKAAWIQKNPEVTAGIMKAVGAISLFAMGLGLAIKIISPFLSAGSKVIQIFDKFKTAGSFANGFKAAFPVLSKILGLFAKFGSFFVTLWGWIQGAASAIAGFFAALTPPGWIVVAIIAIIGVFVLLWNYCKGFREFMINMWNNIKATAVSFVNVLKVVFSNIGNAIKSVLLVIVVILGALLTVIWRILSAGFNILKPVFTAVGSFAIRVFNRLKFAINVVRGVFITVWDVIKSRGIAVWNAVKAKAEPLFSAIKSRVNEVKSKFTEAWNRIKNKASEVWNSIKSTWDNVVNALKSSFTGVADWFKTKWSEIKNFAMSNPISVKIKETWDKVTGGVGAKWTGTNYFEGGLTTVAERGAELIKIPGQSPFLAQSEMLLNLPKGTQILNNFQTRNSLRDKVSGLRDRISGLRSKDNVHVGGDNITIQIIGGNNSPVDIAKEVNRILRERDNRKRRVSFG